MTIIIDRIITPYEIARYNEINRVLSGDMEAWFLTKTEINRNWTSLPKIEFKYRFLEGLYFNFKIIKLLNKYRGKIDRVVCCGWDSFPYLYALWFCKKNKIRYSLWSGSTIYEKSWQRVLFLSLIKFIVAKADDYIVYGTRAKQYLISLGAEREKIKIFLNSVDTDYFYEKALKLKKNRDNLRKKYGIAKEDTVFLYVGQLIKRKSIRELVGGFAKVSSLNKKISLIIAGEGKLKREIGLFMKKNPEIKIKLLGYVQYEELPQIYALSDALILPSKEEVWGLVVNEALASSLPVLVSKFAGCSVDLVDRNNGEIIKEISDKGIAKVIKRFLEKKKYTISSAVLERMRNKKYAEEIFCLLTDS